MTPHIPQIYDTHVLVRAEPDSDIHASLQIAFACLPFVAWAKREKMSYRGAKYVVNVVANNGVQTGFKLHVLPHATLTNEWWLNFVESPRMARTQASHRHAFLHAYATVCDKLESSHTHCDTTAVHPHYQPRYTSESHLTPQEALRRWAAWQAPAIVQSRAPSFSVKHVTSFLYPLLFNAMDRSYALTQLLKTHAKVRERAGIYPVAIAAVLAGFRDGTGLLSDAVLLHTLCCADTTESLMKAASSALCSACQEKGYTVALQAKPTTRCAFTGTCFKCIVCAALIEE